MSEPSKKLLEAREYVNRLRQQPPEPMMEVLKALLLEEQSSQLHKLVTTVQEKLDQVISNK